jgi:hypothetical protein
MMVLSRRRTGAPRRVRRGVFSVAGMLLAVVLLAPVVSAQTTTVTFDNPLPAGASGGLLNGVFQGIDFGTARWRWETAFPPDATNHIYFDSGTGTSRTFTFSGSPQVLNSIRVFTGTAGTLTLTDNLGQTRTQNITVGTLQLVTTGWTQPSATVTVSFTAGWDLGVDDITYTAAAGQVIVVDSISPSSAIAGGAAFVLTVDGLNFALDSTVRWNGANRTTTFNSTTQLTATILAADLAAAGSAEVTVFTASAGNNTSNAQPFAIIAPGASFADDFNRPDNASIGNGWTEKFPGAFSIQSGEVVSINTGTIDYHDAIVYRPVTEDQRDVEVGLEFRILAGQNFPQVHARAQRNTLTQPDTLDDYIFFVDGFEPSPGRAIIARQQPVAGQFECYMMAIPFTTALQQNARYRLRFQVTGANPVTLTGIVERLVGTTWQLFASGTTQHDNTTQNPGIYCDPGFMPPPITTAGAVGFGKWTTNNEVYDNFYWTNLTQTGNPIPTTTSLSPTSASAGGVAFTLTVNGTNFINGSTVRWNGANRATTFVSASQLTAAIPASDITTVGTAAVTVFTAAPGGGTSNAQTFTISAGGASTTVTFDSPVPPGNSGSFLNGGYQGIDFGTNQWAWETAFGPDTTRHIYFGSASGTSRTFTFSPGPRTLVSMRVFTGSNGTLTLTDNLGQTRTQAITTGSMQLVTTSWTQASTTVTVTFSAGWALGVDDIVYRSP